MAGKIRRLKWRAERGVAIVEFTLVSAVLTGLFLAVVQLGFAIHVRNTLTACAAEGARHAANADRGVADGAAHTRALIEESVSPRYAENVVAREVVVEGVRLVEVTVHATLPLFGLLGVDRGMVVRGHAVEESGL